MVSRASEYRQKSIAELKVVLSTLKEDLLKHRVASISSANPQGLTKLRELRKNVACVMTIMTQKARSAAFEEHKGKKFLPKDLRDRRTRAMRRALKKSEKNKVSRRVARKSSKYPMKCFAVKAE
ncbi:putative multi-domain containing protein [Aduncisulcus paluster]|uniref:Multi-domain containing protein n=1 Tax=Aduncisulcus paluster TaxID=2918883 RepID=A0ABQ5KSH0_9EUKA|nr:putative multi-domain containing protein [Aduncisulcus paluster]